jgi:hypothetical protein
MDLKPNKEKLLPYYQTVRQTIQGLDTLITDILTKGATATVAILVGPLAIFETAQNGANWADLRSRPVALQPEIQRKR